VLTYSSLRRDWIISPSGGIVFLVVGVTTAGSRSVLPAAVGHY
jgi:hypothetical protein